MPIPADDYNQARATVRQFYNRNHINGAAGHTHAVHNTRGGVPNRYGTELIDTVRADLANTTVAQGARDDLIRRLERILNI